MKKYIRNGPSYICVFNENEIFGKWFYNGQYFSSGTHTFAQLKNRVDCIETTEEDFNQFMGNKPKKPKDTTGW